MTYILRYAGDVFVDLDEIANYIAAESPARARSFVAALQSHAKTIASRPAAYRLRAEFGDEIRVAGYRGYMLFYRVGIGEVRILRVIHSARDLSELWFD